MKRTLKWVLAVLVVVFVVLPLSISMLVSDETRARWEAKAEVSRKEREAQAAEKVAQKAAEKAAKAENAAAMKTEVKERVSKAMNETLNHAGVRGRWSWEQTSEGWLAVTVEIPEDDAYKARTIGTKGVVAVRNQFYQQELAGFDVHAYRVSVNGPSPGPDMITRYGSARLNRGGQVDWQSGLRR